MGCCSGELGEEDEHDKGRSCTDLFWLVLFAVCWIILSIAAVWSFGAGHPHRLINGYDSFGNICGQKNKRIAGVSWSGMDMTDCPYLFHMDPQNLSYSMKICVAKCADKNLSHDADVSMFFQRTNSMLTRYDFDIRQKDGMAFFPSLSSSEVAHKRREDENKGFGPFPKFPVTKQRPLLSRCVGTERIKLGGNSIINKFYSYIKNNDVPHKVVSDIYTSLRNIGYTLLFSIGVALLVTFTIHYLASVVSTLIMVISSLAVIGLTGFSWFVYVDLRYKLNQIPSIEQFDDDLVNEKTFLIFSIILTIVSVLILIATFIMRTRIGLMVALFAETAACLRSMPSLVFQPVWTCAVLLLFLAFWTTVFLGVSTAEKDVVYNATTTRFKLQLPIRTVSSYNDGNVIFSPTASQYYIESVKHEQPEFVRYLWWFVIIMLFWSTEFILGCEQMTVASSVASWYFSRDRDSLSCPIGRSVRRIAKYHLGSIALGSFLIVLLKIPRLILSYLEYYLKKFKDQYSCVNCTLKCCQCFFYCLENFIRYINHNAYTIIAIEGTSYCFSAKVAFKTLASNTLRIVAINTIGDFIIFLGKCIVTATAATFAVYLMRDDPTVHYLAVPVLFATIGAYFVAHSMLCVYEMVIDTMFLCFVEDVNKNANSPEGFFAPPGLLRFAQEDGQELKPGSLRIANEVNKKSKNGSSPPYIDRQPALSQISDGGSQPQIGFVYPPLVESSH